MPSRTQSYKKRCSQCDKSFTSYSRYRGAFPKCKECLSSPVAQQSVPFQPTSAEIAFTSGPCFIQSITAMDHYADASFEELRAAAYQVSRPPSQRDDFVGQGFGGALELRRMRQHRIALTIAPDGAGGCAAILHLRPTEPRLPSFVAAQGGTGTGWDPSQREAFEPVIIWEPHACAPGHGAPVSAATAADDIVTSMDSVDDSISTPRLRGCRLHSICAADAHVRVLPPAA